jgi:glutathione S-transferase
VDETLVFYTNPMSRGRIVRWMLEEVGAPYRTEVLNYGTTMKAIRYLAVNPMGKVPAIRHGETIVTECAAILAYLADVFPDAGLAPPLDARGPYYRWLFFTAGPLEQAVTNRSLGLDVPQEKEGTVGYGNFATVMNTLEHALAGKDYIAADHFTAADVLIGSHVGWGLQFGTIERRPAFEAYWAGISQREAYQRGNRLDDDLMPEQSGS